MLQVAGGRAGAARASSMRLVVGKIESCCCVLAALCFALRAQSDEVRSTCADFLRPAISLSLELLPLLLAGPSAGADGMKRGGAGIGPGLPGPKASRYIFGMYMAAVEALSRQLGVDFIVTSVEMMVGLFFSTSSAAEGAKLRAAALGSEGVAQIVSQFAGPGGGIGGAFSATAAVSASPFPDQSLLALMTGDGGAVRVSLSVELLLESLLRLFECVVREPSTLRRRRKDVAASGDGPLVLRIMKLCCSTAFTSAIHRAGGGASEDLRSLHMNLLKTIVDVHWGIFTKAGRRARFGGVSAGGRFVSSTLQCESSLKAGTTSFLSTL